VLISDGVSGTLTDQEIVDVVKEAKTPEQGARDVVGFATEVSKEGDNATCLVIRLGGWERRIEVSLLLIEWKGADFNHLGWHGKHGDKRS
jgi:serine/threonine protein phosphatase PrpC